MSRLSRRRPRMAIGAAIVGLGIATVASASVTRSNGVISGCCKTMSGGRDATA